MTIIEKLIKFSNGILNNCISAKVCIKRKTIGLGDIKNGDKLISRKGYSTNIKFTIEDFKVINTSNWGSAFPNMDTVFSEDCVTSKGDSISITTKAEQTTGLDFGGKPLTRPAKSGSIHSKKFLPTSGMYSFDVVLDTRALGSWDAIWFNSNHIDSKFSYREVDIFERFFSSEERTYKLTTSIWKGTSVLNRNLYNSLVNINGYITFKISIEFTKHKIKVYVNGTKIFVGLQWKPKKSMILKINSGLLEGEYNSYSSNLKAMPYKFQISNIKHYTK